MTSLKKAAGKSGRIVKALLRQDLVVIDELGYLPFSQAGAQLRFHLISKLYVSPRVVNGPERQRSRSQSATSPDRRGFL